MSAAQEQKHPSRRYEDVVGPAKKEAHQAMAKFRKSAEGREGAEEELRKQMCRMNKALSSACA